MEVQPINLMQKSSIIVKLYHPRTYSLRLTTAGVCLEPKA